MTYLQGFREVSRDTAEKTMKFPKEGKVLLLRGNPAREEQHLESVLQLVIFERPTTVQP